ncbi:MAG: oligosaccharide flippase family protein, partial [Myxococcota bacterium]
LAGIVQGICTMAASYRLPGKNNRLCWDTKSAREIYHFGRWILLSTAMNFADASADRLIFGKLVSLAALGVYNIGATMAMLSTQVISRISTTLIFPVLSRVNEEGGEVGPQFLRLRKPLLILAAWTSSVLVAGGAPLMHTLYDPSYAESGWILQFLAAGYWFRGPYQMNQVALLALGDSRWVAGLNAIKVLGMVTLIPIGWTLWGFHGAVVAIAGAEFVRYGTSLVATHRHGIRSFAEDLRYTAQVAVASAGGLLLSDWMYEQSVPTALTFLAVAGSVTLLWTPELVPTALQFLRRHSRERA